MKVLILNGSPHSNGNTRIQQIGINSYYEERRNIPHYIEHKK